MSEPNLITSAILQGKEYLVKMNVSDKCLELVISDKQTGEEWQCSYDQAYIENLTHKTGNFKQYDVFVTMIKSGLLKTSDSISLQLLTFEDLDTLRSKKIRRNFSTNNSHGNNRRYLIITYSVEFDRIHYPLPLEYCGPPDPILLQATIRKLEAELAGLREEQVFTKKTPNQVLALQKRVDDLTQENLVLKMKVNELQTTIAERVSKSQLLKSMETAIIKLEKSVLSERKSHHHLVDKLRADKLRLIEELDRHKANEKSLKIQLDKNTKRSINGYKAKPVKSSKTCDKSSDLDSFQTVFRRGTVPVEKSKSDDITKRKFDERRKSISSRQIKSEERVRKNRRSKSNSSSVSSSRNLERFFAMAEFNNYGGDEIPSTSSSSKSKRNENKRSVIKTKPSKSSKSSNSSNASRNSSKSSRHSTISRHSSGSTENSESTEYCFRKQPMSLRGIKTRLRTSDRDFLALENRILKLQDILKNKK